MIDASLVSKQDLDICFPSSRIHIDSIITAYNWLQSMDERLVSKQDQVAAILADISTSPNHSMLLHSDAPNNIDSLHSTVSKIANFHAMLFPEHPTYTNPTSYVIMTIQLVVNR